MIKIRRVKNIFSVDEELTKHIYVYWGLKPQGDWATPHFWYWVAYDKEQWIAYAALRSHSDEILYAGPAFVKEGYRGKGLQKRLLKARIRFSKKIGYKRVISSTDTDNIWSSNSLITCGFKLIPPWEGISPKGLFWEKII